MRRKNDTEKSNLEIEFASRLVSEPEWDISTIMQS